MKDLHSTLHFVPLIEPIAARTDDTAITSSIIDTNGFAGCELVIVTGTNTDANATFAVEVTESDDSGMSGATAVSDEDLLGTETAAGFAFGDDVECRKIGYIGSKRYLQLTVTPSGNTGDVFIAGVAVLGGAREMPTPTL